MRCGTNLAYFGRVANAMRLTVPREVDDGMQWLAPRENADPFAAPACACHLSTPCRLDNTQCSPVLYFWFCAVMHLARIVRIISYVASSVVANMLV